MLYTIESMNEHSLEDILRVGEELYLSKLKGKLEDEAFGHYVVIDTDTGAYLVHASKLEALEKAKKEFGTAKIFYTVQIGSLDKPTINYHAEQRAWSF